MKLIFIHGWGLDATLWDGVCTLLPEFEQERVDLGFFGPSKENYPDTPSILIGHSLGFVHGLSRHQNWHGWIAINSFPRFVESRTSKGCVSAPVLRDMRMRLIANTNLTLFGFYQLLGLPTPTAAPNTDRLRDALDELHDLDRGGTAAKLSPGLVIASQNDPLVPVATSEALAEGKDILLHDDGGHVLPHSDPTFCAKAIRNFMEQHGFHRA